MALCRRFPNYSLTPQSMSEITSSNFNSEPFGNVPNSAEEFGSSPKPAEDFRTMRNDAERKENHTLTVREVARMFETAGVARTERSIINWCQPNKTGVARLDCYFDPNDRKYFVTPQSVEMAIAEEKAKAARTRDPISEHVGNVPHGDTPPAKNPESTDDSEGDSDRVKSLEREVMDLRIVNRGKDYFIEQMKSESERMLGQLVSSSRKVGELETRLLQLGEPGERGNDSNSNSDFGLGGIRSTSE
jgi:hypothetical protein